MKDDTWPPRTDRPENAPLSRVFDKLVSSNLQLVKTLYVAMAVMIALTFTAVCIAGYTASAVKIVLDKCDKGGK